MENSNWKEFHIEDFAEIVNHKRIPLSTLERTNRKGAFPYYGASGIIDYVDNYIFEGKHILVSEDGENLRSRNTPIAFQADGRFWVNNHAHILKCTKEYYNNLLIYYFQNVDLNPFLTGAVQPKLNKASLTKIPIILPAGENQQKAIASVLSSLDDKIDLLHQQNQTLEALAETLFRQWFIEEAKEDWEEVKLGDLVDVFNGVSYKSDDLNPSTTAMVTLKSFERNGGFRMDGFKEYTGKYKETHVVEEGDLVVAHTDITQDAALIGNPVLVKSHPNYDKLVISMDLVKVVSKNSNFTNEFLYLLMKTREFKEHALGYSNGSTVLHLSKKAIPEFELKLPPNELVHLFTEKVSHLIKKQFDNQNQIQTLTQLRDTLLPKLMSGEVRVKL